jgi:hypothetical protein
MGKHGFAGPSTFRRNNNKVPIDGIWATPGVSMIQGKYFGFDEVFLHMDHRCLWIDISYVTAFDHSMPAVLRPKAHCLNCRDPRLNNNYIKEFKMSHQPLDSSTVLYKR